MRKFLVMVLSVVGLTLAQGSNWAGYGDTSTVWSCSDTVKYSSSFYCSDLAMAKVVIGVDDTSAAGLHNDSADVVWGMQTYSFCYNRRGVVDTCFNERVILDTLRCYSADSVAWKTIPVSYVDSLGILYRGLGYVDSLHDSGWAMQSRGYQDIADRMVRYWVQGLARNKVGSYVRVLFTHLKKVLTK